MRAFAPYRMRATIVIDHDAAGDIRSSAGTARSVDVAVEKLAKHVDVSASKSRVGMA